MHWKIVHKLFPVICCMDFLLVKCCIVNRPDVLPNNCPKNVDLFIYTCLKVYTYIMHHLIFWQCYSRLVIRSCKFS